MKTYLIVGALIAAGAVALMYQNGSLSGGGMSNAVTAPLQIAELNDPAVLVERATGIETGNSDARITILEFGDFQCPACREFWSIYKPQLEAAYIDNGLVGFVFHDYPLSIHPNAFFAARAARCAEAQGQFWAYHDMLFQNQSSWSFLQAPGGAFVDYAGELGLDSGDFRSCLDSEAHAEVVTANFQLAQALAIPGTPGILIQVEGNPRAVRPADYSFASIKAVVDSLLAVQPQQ